MRKDFFSFKSKNYFCLLTTHKNIVDLDLEHDLVCTVITINGDNILNISNMHTTLQKVVYLFTQHNSLSLSLSHTHKHKSAVRYNMALLLLFFSGLFKITGRMHFVSRHKLVYLKYTCTTKYGALLQHV